MVLFTVQALPVFLAGAGRRADRRRFPVRGGGLRPGQHVDRFAVDVARHWGVVGGSGHPYRGRRAVALRRIQPCSARTAAGSPTRSWKVAAASPRSRNRYVVSCVGRGSAAIRRRIPLESMAGSWWASPGRRTLAAPRDQAQAPTCADRAAYGAVARCRNDRRGLGGGPGNARPVAAHTTGGVSTGPRCRDRLQLVDCPVWRCVLARWRGLIPRRAMTVGLVGGFLILSWWFTWWADAGVVYSTGITFSLSGLRRILEDSYAGPVVHPAVLTVAGWFWFFFSELALPPVDVLAVAAAWVVPLLAWTFLSRSCRPTPCPRSGGLLSVPLAARRPLGLVSPGHRRTCIRRNRRIPRCTVSTS